MLKDGLPLDAVVDVLSTIDDARKLRNDLTANATSLPMQLLAPGSLRGAGDLLWGLADLQLRQLDLVAGFAKKHVESRLAALQRHAAPRRTVLRASGRKDSNAEGAFVIHNRRSAEVAPALPVELTFCKEDGTSWTTAATSMFDGTPPTLAPGAKATVRVVVPLSDPFFEARRTHVAQLDIGDGTGRGAVHAFDLRIVVLG
jgi:hypothetical protein